MPLTGSGLWEMIFYKPQDTTPRFCGLILIMSREAQDAGARHVVDPLAVLLATSLLLNAALGLLLFWAHVRVRAAEHDMEIELPKVELPSHPSRLLVVTVRENGRYNVSGREVSEEELRTVIGRAVTEDPDQKVIIRSDPSAESRHVAKAIAICSELGVPEANIGFTYRPVETQPRSRVHADWQPFGGAKTDVAKMLPTPGFHLHVTKSGFEINGVKGDIETLKKRIRSNLDRVDSVRISVLVTKDQDAAVPENVWRIIDQPSIDLYGVRLLERR